LAGSFLQSESAFQIPVLLQAFDIRFPLDVLVPAEASTTAASIPFLLTDNGVPQEERPIELLSPSGLPVGFSTIGLTGIDMNNLVGDPETTGDPFVTVQAVSPGIPGTYGVGLGLAFVQTPGTWNLRAGYAGAVSSMGFFGMNGLVDTDVFLEVEARDALGNRVGSRRRQSQLDGLPLTGILFPVDAPVLDSPLPGASSAGEAFNLVFDETLIDFYGELGFYRAELEDDAGRRWQIWRVDRPGATPAVVRMRVPDVTVAGGQGLLDGTIRASLSTFGVPGLDPGAFMWSDIPREHDVFSEAAPVSFQKP